jgi:trk system potassium uptake protein TrkH
MDRQLICRLLGLISLLTGASMALSLPWTLPLLGQTKQFDSVSFLGLFEAMIICAGIGGGLMYVGRSARGRHLFRREAIAVVGLSWILATLLGAVPFWLTGTCRSVDTKGHPVRMDLFDGIFESASGFSGTGATVLQDLEDPALIAPAILFWRSETHFLGGIGIMVLFVAVLGLGSAGKALMLTEMPGPSQESSHARSQRAAGTFAVIFVGLTGLLTFLLWIESVPLFHAICHAFGTVATGGFSTFNDSVAHFGSVSVEMTITLFMILACTNFTLLYYVVLLQPSKLARDIEFRTYLFILFAATTAVVATGLYVGDFADFGQAVRYGLFQVTSILTNTGFGTRDFDKWNSLSRAILLVLMFIGGCAGSTSCSIKVIRYVLLLKIFWIELERSFHPNVVRWIRLGGKPLDAPDLRKNVTLYFSVFLMIFVVGWVTLVALEPDSTWIEAHHPARDKLIDCASAVAATLNGVGPGLGIVGEAENYGHFHAASKLVLTWIMLLGRLEIFVLLALLVPRFWRR